MTRANSSSGYTLIELITAVVLLAVLASLAAPSVTETLRRTRIRSVLEQLSADIYRTRAMAVRSGREMRIRFDAGGGACVQRYALEDVRLNLRVLEVDLEEEAPGVCLSVSGSNVIRINSRGMPVGAARKVRVRMGHLGDSISISMVGRVYRWGVSVQ